MLKSNYKTQKNNNYYINIDNEDNILVLTGKVKNYEQKLKAGFIAANKGFKGVVNKIEVEGLGEDTISKPLIKDNILENEKFDVTIIGAGIIGSSIARELSKYNLKIALLEKEGDVAKHASSRNDGLIHPGFAPHPNTLKAKYNVEGNRLFDNISKELNIDFKRTGEIIVFGNPYLKYLIPFFKKRAKDNGIKEYYYLSKNEIKSLEPYVTDNQYGGFYLPSAGIVSPYKLTIAMAENAIQNGVKLYLNTIVNGFEIVYSSKKSNRSNNKPYQIIKIKTNRGDFFSRLIINAAGLWSDYIAELANDQFFSIHPRKGVDAILDIKTGKFQKKIMAIINFKNFNSRTKGGGVVPTIEGNILVGPTAEEIPFKEDYSTDAKDIELLVK